MDRSMAGKVAVVVGASKGAGRGVALELAWAGATVYVLARSVPGRQTAGYEPAQTVDGTVEQVRSRGGTAVGVPIDCMDAGAMRAFFDRVRADHGGLDVLVNAAWEDLWDWKETFWDHALEKGLKLMALGLNGPIIASRFAAPLMVGRGRGLIVTVTDVEDDGCLYYRMVKAGVRKMTATMADELRPHGVAAVALRSGYMVFHDEIREGVTTTDPEYERRHHPRFNGRAVVALATAADPLAKTGRVVAVSDLAVEYGFTDVDGRQPAMFC